jgi:hypothetical protein
MHRWTCGTWEEDSGLTVGMDACDRKAVLGQRNIGRLASDENEQLLVFPEDGVRLLAFGHGGKANRL